MGRILNTIAVVGLATAAVACGSDAAEESADESADTPEESAGASEETTDAADEPAESADAPSIVVTTNILGDVVAAALGDSAEVEVIMPLGASPHDFAPSAREAETMENADLLIVNGAGFEEGMLDVIANVSDSGTAVFTVAEHVELIDFTGDDDHGDEHSDEHGDEHGEEDHADEDEHDHGDEDHGDEEHSDEEHSDEDHAGEDDHDHGDEDHADEDDHDHGDEDHGDEEHSDEEHSDEDHADEDHADEHGDDDHADDGDHDHSHADGEDPHLWTDPARIADAVTALEPVVAALGGVDAAALSASIAAYLGELTALETAMEASLASVADAERVLVTNHQVFGYFAERFDFEVVGAIIPSLTTNAEPSASDIEELAELIEAEGIGAIFGETTQSSQLAEVLADEVGGDVAVVELFGESLGDSGSGAETYIEMMQANADLIAEALTS